MQSQVVAISTHDTTEKVTRGLIWLEMLDALTALFFVAWKNFQVAIKIRLCCSHEKQSALHSRQHKGLFN